MNFKLNKRVIVSIEKFNSELSGMNGAFTITKTVVGELVYFCQYGKNALIQIKKDDGFIEPISLRIPGHYTNVRCLKRLE